MINVLYVITKGRWGGAQKYVYDLATTLPWRKFKVSVAVGEGEELPRRLRLTGLEVIPLPALARAPHWRNDWRSFRQLKRLFDEKKPDLIHLNSSKAGLMGALAARLHNLPRRRQPARIIFTVHGWAFNEDRSRPARWTIKLLSWLTVILSHRAITVSKFDLMATKHWPLVKGKLSLVRNGIAAPHWLPRAQARKKLGLESQAFLAGIIAELHQNKGLTYLLQALSLSRLNFDNKFRLVIIGEGEERSRLEEQIKHFRLSENVLLVGQIDHAAALLPAFDLFILPSIKEGLPYVLLEAGAASLPVLATAVGGIPEIIENMKSGVLVKPKQPAELARALEFLVQNPKKRREFGANLRRRVRDQFSTVRMVKETIAIYNEWV